MHIKARYWAAPGVLVAAGAIAVGVWLASPRPAQFTLRMTPVRPLTTAACVAEAHSYGYSISAAGIVCQPGTGHSWYRATLTNGGSYGLPTCTATGYDVHGKPVFAGRLAFAIGGIRGLFVPAHRSITFYWYLPSKTRLPVARYKSACSPAPNMFSA